MAEKNVIRTDRAPGPFQGAPYNQGIQIGDLVFVAGQLGIRLETGELAGSGVAEQTEQIMANLGAILEAAGSGLDKLVKTTVFLMDLADFAAMNEVYATHVGDRPAGTIDRADLGASERRTRRDRGYSARLSVDPAATMRPCAPSRSSQRTGIPTSTRSARCSLRGFSTRPPSSQSGR